MKNGFILVFLACSIQLRLSAQNIGINATGALPHASAMLDVSATNKGFLMPRMTTLQREAITTPAEGLKVYDTDTKTFWFYNGTGWIQSATGAATNYWGLNGTNIFNTNTGNVGIGLNMPLAPLHIKNDNEALRIQGATPFVSFYDNTNALTGFIQQYNNDLYLGTPSTNTSGIMQFYLQNIPVMTLKPEGQLKIGSGPTFPNTGFSLSQDGSSTVLGITANNGQAQLISNRNITLYPQSGIGNVGINTPAPVNKLQIGSMGGTGFATNDFAIGNGVSAMAIQQTTASTLIGSSTNVAIMPRNDGTGYLGINTLTPTNKLQIGSVGTTGFATNDLAIGNGTNAMAIYQTNAATLIGSTTDIILKPRNNGHGRVGINTNNPRVPLEVADGVDVSGLYSAFYSYLNGLNDDNNVGTADANPIPNITILTSGRVVANEFDAVSDARIKNVSGISNGAVDLETVNSLRITNYSMKDKVKYGNKSFKKIIAQEVEKVYPQVVSKHTDYVPNVYQVTSQIKKTAMGYLLSFTNPHNISANAKKLRILLPESEGMQVFEVVAVPDNRQVVIKAEGIKSDTCFVYGEEVDDFRSVDYEGLTTLNISATQQISWLITEQATTIANQQKSIDLLQKRLMAIEKNVSVYKTKPGKSMLHATHIQ